MTYPVSLTGTTAPVLTALAGASGLPEWLTHILAVLAITAGVVGVGYLIWAATQAPRYRRALDALVEFDPALGAAFGCRQGSSSRRSGPIDVGYVNRLDAIRSRSSREADDREALDRALDALESARQEPSTTVTVP